MQVVDEVAPLAPAGLVCAEAAGDEVVAAARARGPRDLALEHDGAQRLLGRIVGRLHTRMRDEPPQRGPHLQQVGAGVGRATATLLRSTFFQRAADASLQWLELRLCRLARRAPAKQHIPRAQQTPTDAPGLTRAFAHAPEIAQQVRPTDLALSGVDEGIGRVPIGHHHASGRQADQVLRDVACPGRPDAEDGQFGLDHAPHPVARSRAFARIVRLVHVHNRGGSQTGARLAHRRGQGGGHLAVGLRDRPDAEVHAQHLGQQITHLALGEVVARAQRADARQGSRADLAARHACRRRP